MLDLRSCCSDECLSVAIPWCLLAFVFKNRLQKGEKLANDVEKLVRMVLINLVCQTKPAS